MKAKYFEWGFEDLSLNLTKIPLIIQKKQGGNHKNNTKQLFPTKLIWIEDIVQNIF